MLFFFLTKVWIQTT